MFETVKNIISRSPTRGQYQPLSPIETDEVNIETDEVNTETSSEVDKSFGDAMKEIKKTCTEKQYPRALIMCISKGQDGEKAFNELKTATPDSHKEFIDAITIVHQRCQESEQYRSFVQQQITNALQPLTPPQSPTRHTAARLDGSPIEQSPQSLGGRS